MGVQTLRAGICELTDYVYFLLEESKNEPNDRNMSPHVEVKPFEFSVLAVTQDGEGHIPKSGVRPQCRVGRGSTGKSAYRCLWLAHWPLPADATGWRG